MVELLLSVALLTVAMVALVGGYLGQQTLNEHARNLTLAVQDAERVIEQLRDNNSRCTTPTARPPGVLASWDAWMSATPQPKTLPDGRVVPDLTTGGGPKSFANNPEANERIAVTCQDQDGGALPADHCGQGAPNVQVGAGEWSAPAGNTAFNPMRVTVAVCWRHRGRTIGECTWSGAILTPSDTGNGVIESLAMLTTLVTCR